MKKRFVVLCCLFLALSTAWGATLLSEGFDGMSDKSLPEGWTCSLTAANIGYYTTSTYSDVPPSLKLTTDGMTLTSPTFFSGATNVSFLSYTTVSGVGNEIKVEGWADDDWVNIGTATCTEKGKQTYSLPVANSDITQLRFTFTKEYNASLDDILVEGAESGVIVTFDRTNWFEVVEGTAGETVTATASNGTEPYTYVWNCDQSEEITDVAGATLAIPDTLAEGDYTLCVTVTDSDDGELGPQGGNFLIGLRVVKKYAVTAVNGIDANGTISVSPELAAAGEEVTIAWEPDPGYVLESLGATWAGGDLEIAGGKFTMPAGAVTVTATFAAYEGGELTITFDANKTTDPGYAATSFTSATLPEEAADVEFDALRCYGGDAGTSGKSMRVQNIAGTNGFFATANAFGKPVSRIRFAYKAYNDKGTEKDWVLQTSADGSAWTTVATLTPASHEEWATADVTDAIPANSTYFRITGAETNTTKNAWAANFDEIDLWFGEATYHVELSGVENGARVPYDEDNPAVTLTAEAKDGGTAPFVYAWTVNGEPVDGYTGATREFSALGAYEVSVTCTDANDVTTEAVSTSFSIERQYAVSCPVGLTGGAISADVAAAFEGDTVTLAVEAEEGYALDGELAASWAEGDLEIADNAFTMPAGDVTVSGSFRAVADTATLPFEWHGPWREKLAALDGVTGALGADGSDKNYENQGNGIAVFQAKSHNFCVKFDGAPATVSYWIHGTAYETNAYTFQVQESADGETWSDVAVYTSTDEGIDGYAQVTNDLSETSRYVKFSFLERSTGTVGVDGIVIAAAEGPGPGPEPAVPVTATVTSALSLEGGVAKLGISLDNAGVVPTADDIWAADDLTDARAWKQAEGATVVAIDGGGYEVTVPEAAGNYIAIGKPSFLAAE